jgi:hypothetical protein
MYSGVKWTFLLFPCILLMGCGKDACEELHDIQKEICAPANRCFPCVCILQNQSYDLPIRMGLPDVTNASCTGGRGSCNGENRELAKRCLALGRPEEGDENWEAWISECDPRYANNLWMFDSNEDWNRAFPDVCSLDW